MFTGHHVVRDLNEVINLRAFADDGRSEGAAIDCHVRADLHVVVDDDVADLRHLAVFAFIEDVAEAVRADDCAGVDTHAVADDRTRIERDVVKDDRALADLAADIHVNVPVQTGMFADGHALGDDAVRTDARGRMNLRRWRDRR